MTDLLVPVNGFRLTPTACLVDGRPSYDEWATVIRWAGQMLLALEKRKTQLQFAIGDLLNQGENRYGETDAQAASETGLAPQTLMNYKSVAKAIPPELRIDGLSYSAHREIAFAEPELRKELLDWAKFATGHSGAPSSREVAEMARAATEHVGMITVRLTPAEGWAVVDEVAGASYDSARKKIRKALLAL